MADVKDFVIENGLLKKYTGNDRDVVIPDGVTCIGERAFENCEDIVSITIPEGVTRIRKEAFERCNGLRKLKIPTTLAKVDEPMSSCGFGLREILYPSLEAWLKHDKEKWQHLLQDCILVIDGKPLRDLILPDGVKNVPERAFEGIGGIKSLTIPESVTEIGRGAFACCKDLEEVDFRGELVRWDASVFGGCVALRKVKLPKRLEEIPTDGFSNTALTEIEIPDGVRGIGNFAFQMCENLSKITIQNSIARIRKYAFESKVLNVYYRGSIESWITMDKHLWDDECLKYNLYINDELVDYVTIPDNMTCIGTKAFNGCVSLQSVSIPASVTSIGAYAFAHSGLKSVMIPASVTKIEEGTFSDCSSLESVGIPASVTSIEKYAFAHSGLKNVTIPASVTQIERNAFLCCKFPVVMISPNVRGMGDEAFAGPALKRIIFERRGPGFSMKWFGRDSEIVFPGDTFATTEKISTGYCSEKIRFSEKEIAYLTLYQKGATWKKFLKKVVAGKEKAVFNHMLVRCAEDENAPIKVIEEFVGEYAKKLTPEQRESARDFLEKKKEEPSIMEKKTEMGASSNETNKEKSVEERVRELCQRFPLSEEAKKTVKQGLPYAGSNQLSSCEAVAFILSEYGKEWERCAKDVVFPKYDARGEGIEDGKNIKLHPEADEIAAALDRSTLSAFLTKLVSSGDYRPWLIAWARFASDSRVKSMTAAYKTEMAGEPEAFYKANSMREALLINDTRAAIQFFDRIGELKRYAKMRGTTAWELRDSALLPTFGFDENGIKRYDIGGNTIEVSIAPDLSLELFDVGAQKSIRSFPKKSDDQTKVEACAEDFVTLRKEMRAFIKERTRLLHRMHISGGYLRADLWLDVYVDHPVVSRLGKLVVWQDELGKTFMITKDGKGVTNQDCAYEPQGKIRVAHVFDMEDSDIAAWQQWLATHGCVQLFEQVWEPIICWNRKKLSNRYSKGVLTNKGWCAVKAALSLRGFNVSEDRSRYDNSGTIQFGKCLRLRYKEDEKTKSITFEDVRFSEDVGNREMNALLLELDKAMLSAQVARDNGAALTDQVLSEYTAAQIAGFMNVAISSKATRCMALLRDYRNKHFPEFASVSEFSLDQ